jgi:hypothetical protein
MTLTDFFTYLGAPLVNQRWSWGAVRPGDGAVFLRVWQDEGRKIDGSWYTQVTFTKFFSENAASLGYAERLEHISAIRGGKSSYMIMCLARDPAASPREVSKFNRDDIFVGGRLIEIEGDCWLERINRLPVSALRTKI